MKPLIQRIIDISSRIGIELDSEAVYFILGILVPVFATLIWRLVCRPIVRAFKHWLHERQVRNLFALIVPRLSRISFFPIYPNLDIKDNPRNPIRIVVEYPKSPFQFAPPLENLDDTLSEFLLERRLKIREDPAFQTHLNELRERVKDADFSESDIVGENGEPDRLKVFGNMLNDKTILHAAKKTVLWNYLLGGSEGNGFLHNGKVLAITDYQFSKSPTEGEELQIRLQVTDYFSYRVIAELAGKINSQWGLRDLVGTTPDGLAEYLPRFQKNLHLSLGLGIMVHTYRDNRVIITRRSGNAAKNVNEAGKYFMSACEGINDKDIDSNDQTQLQPLFEIVQRAIREELYGNSSHTPNLSALVKKCVVTGSFLYLPNLSIELCVYVGMDCSSKDIRLAYQFAKDRGLETSCIIEEKRWDKQTGLPRFHPISIHRFVKRTLRGKGMDDVWDQGALTTLLLSAYVEDEKYRGSA
jgi:hypothetical protein